MDPESQSESESIAPLMCLDARAGEAGIWAMVGAVRLGLMTYSVITPVYNHCYAM